MLRCFFVQREVQNLTAYWAILAISVIVVALMATRASTASEVFSDVQICIGR